MSNDDVRTLAAVALRLERQRLSECYDSRDLSSRPSNKQLELLKDIGKIGVRYLIASNQSGKTSAGVREMAWILNANHPWWKRPEEWGNGPLFFIIAGQNRTNIEEEIWKRKLKPLLIDREDWKERKAGGIVTSIRNEKNGNTILFLVHGQGTEETRAALQGYRAHYILFDEMPKEFSTFTEIQMRTDAYNGYILVAFTPLLRNLQMKNAVENAAVPYSKKYIWTIWDNPMNCTPEKKIQIEQRAATWSESERQTRMYGEWSADEQAVYHFNLEQMTADLPPNYNKGTWRHVESTDPATTGTTGFTIWAEDPSTGVWYCVQADYIKGDANRAPSRTVQEVYGKTLGYNIVRRVSDTMPWYTAAARDFNLIYTQPWNKTQRKDELIKNLQEALTSGTIKVCKTCTLMIEEFMTCRWKENSDNGIVGSQRFHLLDAAQYFNDLKPKTEVIKLPTSRDAWIMAEWEKTQKKEAHVAASRAKTKSRITMRGRRPWSR